MSNLPGIGSAADLKRLLPSKTWNSDTDWPLEDVKAWTIFITSKRPITCWLRNNQIELQPVGPQGNVCFVAVPGNVSPPDKEEFVDHFDLLRGHSLGPKGATTQSKLKPFWPVYTLTLSPDSGNHIGSLMAQVDNSNKPSRWMIETTKQLTLKLVESPQSSGSNSASNGGLNRVLLRVPTDDNGCVLITSESLRKYIEVLPIRQRDSDKLSARKATFAKGAISN
jgi:hypothetical protein